MLSCSDFKEKQMIFVFMTEGEKISFSNDNIVLKDKDEKIKFQTSCYRLFTVFIIGHFTLTTPLIQKAKKFGFSIFLLTATLRVYENFASKTMGNTMLRKKQYDYNSLEAAKLITYNKIINQIDAIKKVRNHSINYKNECEKLFSYAEQLENTKNLQEIMGFEGSASRLYFPSVFSNVIWTGRRPRVKNNPVNTALDLGYTILFNIIESILNLYGFDLYVGVLHREFYMRKSLVCDLVEPLRPLIDLKVNKAFGLKQFSEDDFIKINDKYILNFKENSKYIKVLMEPILENKERIFLFIQSYYRSFMKNIDKDNYRLFKIEL